MSEQKNTLFEQAKYDAEQPTGRWARHSPVTVTGSGTADPLPVATHDAQAGALPTEPPLGFEVDALPDMTTLNGEPRQ